jgi:hypothetical protein
MCLRKIYSRQRMRCAEVEFVRGENCSFLDQLNGIVTSHTQN